MREIAAAGGLDAWRREQDQQPDTTAPNAPRRGVLPSDYAMIRHLAEEGGTVASTAEQLNLIRRRVNDVYLELINHKIIQFSFVGVRGAKHYRPTNNGFDIEIKTEGARVSYIDHRAALQPTNEAARHLDRGGCATSPPPQDDSTDDAPPDRHLPPVGAGSAAGAIPVRPHAAAYSVAVLAEPERAWPWQRRAGASGTGADCSIIADVPQRHGWRLLDARGPQRHTLLLYPASERIPAQEVADRPASDMATAQAICAALSQDYGCRLGEPALCSPHEFGFNGKLPPGAEAAMVRMGAGMLRVSLLCGGGRTVEIWVDRSLGALLPDGEYEIEATLDGALEIIGGLGVAHENRNDITHIKEIMADMVRVEVLRAQERAHEPAPPPHRESDPLWSRRPELV